MESWPPPPGAPSGSFAARRVAQQLRDLADVVVVGASTVVADNPA